MIDSLAVIVRHRTEPGGLTEYDATGDIAADGDGSLIKWGRAVGIK
jgi:hypothetical protein